MASELAAALAKVQAELPHIAKKATANTGSYSYDYADLTDVSEKIMPLLGKHGLAFTAWPTLDEGRFVLSYTLLHESGEERTGTYPLPEKGTPQQLGGHITYARRYCLCAVTGAAPGGDDNDAAGAQEMNTDRPQRRGPERYYGNDRPSETPVRGPRPGPEHERLRQEPPTSGLWDGEDHWKDQPAGQLPKPPTEPSKPRRNGKPPLTPAQKIALHFDRLGVTDRTDRLVQTTILAGREELIGTTNDLDEAIQLDIGKELAKCPNQAALKALLDSKRAEVAS